MLVQSGEQPFGMYMLVCVCIFLGGACVRLESMFVCMCVLCYAESANVGTECEESACLCSECALV